MVLEETDTRLVDVFGSVTVILRSGIYGAPLSIPHTQSTLVQPRLLPLIRLDESPDLAIATDVPLW